MTMETDQSGKQADAAVQRQALGIVLLAEFCAGPKSVIEETQRRMVETGNEFLLAKCSERAVGIAQSDGNKTAGNYLLGNSMAFAYLDRLAQQTGSELPVADQTGIDGIEKGSTLAQARGQEIRRTMGKRAEKEYWAQVFRDVKREFDPILGGAVEWYADLGGRSRKDAANFYAGARFVNRLLTRQPAVAAV